MVPPPPTGTELAAPPDTRRALVVEDDEDVRELIGFALTSQGFEVCSVDSGQAAIDLVCSLDPDLVTLDLGLPGIDGIETCRRIREVTDAYVVMITGRDDEIDRLIGLETGADDYLSKPFNVRELRARVNAMFRRPRRVAEAAPRVVARPTAEVAAPADPAGTAPSPSDHEVLRHHGLVVDVDAREATRDGETLPLTRLEFDLLAQLMRSPARVWSRESLLRAVWDTEWSTDTHLVEVHVGNLRRKLGTSPSGGGYLRTVRGVGYRMETPAS
ncbi:response regulator transcription factor [Nocardioides nanhaiensis]|uniref:Response regulator transcription factor n=1 Tax=Nocardioides nanhaiensis TaxID=1476871 RepID=A0ABP8WGA5_9ACTN